MRKVLPIVLFLSACTHTQDTGLAKSVQIPDLPPNLAQKAEPLPPLTDPTMGGLVKSAIDTDMKYNSKAYQLNSLIDLYNCVKTSINDKKDIKSCLQ